MQPLTSSMMNCERKYGNRRHREQQRCSWQASDEGHGVQLQLHTPRPRCPVLHDHASITRTINPAAKSSAGVCRFLWFVFSHGGGVGMHEWLLYTIPYKDSVWDCLRG
jgi:phosphopantetheinyl transferase